MVFKDKKYQYKTKDGRKDGNDDTFVRETTKEELNHIKNEIYDDLKNDLKKQHRLKDIAKKAGGGGASVLLITAILRMFGLDPTVTPEQIQTDPNQKIVIELTHEEKDQLFNGIMSEKEHKDLMELIRISKEVKKTLDRSDLTPTDIIRHAKDVSIHVWNKEDRKLNPIIDDMQKRTAANEKEIIELKNKK